MTRQRLLTILAIAAGICGIAFIIYEYFHDPAQGDVPACLFKRLTGYDCPGCGSQRAFHALAHGDIAAAWHYNAAVFVAVPLALLYITGGRRIEALHRPAVLWTIVAAIIAWWIARNL